MDWIRISEQLPDYEIPALFWNNMTKGWLLGIRISVILPDYIGDALKLSTCEGWVPFSSVIKQITHWKYMDVPKDVLT
jgi:hypothetical protein